MTFAAKIIRVVEERRLTERLIRRLVPGTLRALQRPTIGDFLAACQSPSWNSEELLDKLLGKDWRARAPDYRDHFGSIAKDLSERYRQHNLPLPLEHCMDEESLFALYAWIRHRKPRLVVETGVLNGHSTVFLISAVMRNGAGEVHSVDIRPDAGGLINEQERKHWSFHLLPAHGSRRSFRELISSLAPIEIFFHDSQHSYYWQMLEYDCAFSAMTPGGLLGSDDADGNQAFLDFAKSVELRPEVLLDARKVTGFIVRPE